MNRKTSRSSRIPTNGKAFLVIVCLLFAFPTLGAAITVSDDSGREIRLARPAERIVSLAPHSTELLFAAGAGRRIVGVARHSDHPSAATEIPRIGDAHHFDIERILALQPDLVVAWESGNPGPQIRRLQRLGLTVYLSEPRRLQDIAAAIEALGELAGTSVQATQAAAAFRQRLAALRTEYARRPTLKIFYQVWSDPLITVGAGHVINEVMAVCGGRNVFAGINQLAPRIDPEAVLAAAPQVIIASGADRRRPHWLDQWRRWPQLPAVRHDRLYFIPPDIVQRHGPRLLDGAQRLCEILAQARDQSGQ